MIVLVRIEFFDKSIDIYLYFVKVGLFFVELDKFSSGEFAVDAIHFVAFFEGIVHKVVQFSLFDVM